jgi:hypothetical protein
MSKHYLSYEEEELYREGKNDEKHHRQNYDRDKYSEEDMPYFDGRDDEVCEEKRREEERILEEEQERREQERQEQRREEEKMEYEQYLEEQQYYDDQAEIDEISNIDLDTIFPEFPEDNDE